MDAARPFGLSRDPFVSTIGPDEAYGSHAFVAARDALLRELRQGARLVALVGAAGTGKTLLLRAVEQTLIGEGRRVRRFDRGDVALGHIADADVVLVDEADRIDDSALAALSQAAADPASPAVVLATVRRRFDLIVGPVAPRVVTLDELSAADARALIVDRVRRAGGDPALFTPGALGAITYASKGSPRLLRLLSAAALFQATQDGAARVEMGHARRAIAMQKGIAEDVAYPEEAEPVPAPVVPLDISPRAEKIDVSPAVERPAIKETPPPAPAPREEPPAIAPAPLPIAEPVPEALPPRREWLRPAAIAVGATALLAGSAALLWVTETRSPPPATVAAEPSVTPIAPRPASPAQEPQAKPVAAASTPPAKEMPPVEEQPAPRPEATPPVVQEPAPEPPSTKPAAPAVVEAPPRIIVSYASDQPGAREAAERVAALLRARDYDVIGVRGIPGRIREPSIHYGSGNRTAVEAVNRAFEQALDAYQPGATSRITRAGASGTVEVRVPDSAAGASRPLRMDLPPG